MKRECKAVCGLLEAYREGFWQEGTSLFYGKRLDGPEKLGVLARPEEVEAGVVNGVPMPMGYGSGIEDMAYHNGMLLWALVDAWEATGDEALAAWVGRVFQGLEGMARIARTPGFIPRGPHPDGVHYYADTSLDQISLYAAGLCALYRSGLATPAWRQAIRGIVRDTLSLLARNGWRILREDGLSPAYVGGDMKALRGQMPLTLLMLLRVGMEVAGDKAWAAAWAEFATRERWQAALAPAERGKPGRYTMFTNQIGFRMRALASLLGDEARAPALRRGLADMARDMAESPFFRAFRSLDWLGGEAVAIPGSPETRECAAQCLRPLGLSLEGTQTVYGLFERYDPAHGPGKRLGLEGMYRAVAFYAHEFVTLAEPAAVWQLCLLSGDPGLAGQAAAAVDEALDRVDPSAVESGWTMNYLVLAALWRAALR